MKFREVFESEVAVNSAGGGAVAGIGVGPEGEPGVEARKRRGEREKYPGDEEETDR